MARLCRRCGNWLLGGLILEVKAASITLSRIAIQVVDPEQKKALELREFFAALRLCVRFDGPAHAKRRQEKKRHLRRNSGSRSRTEQSTETM